MQPVSQFFFDSHAVRLGRANPSCDLLQQWWFGRLQESMTTTAEGDGQQQAVDQNIEITVVDSHMTAEHEESAADVGLRLQAHMPLNLDS